MFQNMGPSPSGRSGHAMASNGTRVFVLGGESSAGAQADETALIHVLDTSACLFYYFLWAASKCENIQNTSSIRKLTPTLLNLVTRPNWGASYLQVSRLQSRSNHHDHHLHPVPMRHEEPLLHNRPLIPRSCAARSPRRMPARSASVLMI
jgi:hypothetical protein